MNIVETHQAIHDGRDLPGIPIYVDPIGLAEAKLTMGARSSSISKTSPCRSIKTLLDYALRPMDFRIDVRDGFLMISSRTAILEHRVEEIDHKLDRVIEMLERLEPAK